MDSEHKQPSAKIYRFPAERRAGPGTVPAHALRVAKPEAPVVEPGGWYHDAAVEEARRSANKWESRLGRRSDAGTAMPTHSAR